MTVLDELPQHARNGAEVTITARSDDGTRYGTIADGGAELSTSWDASGANLDGIVDWDLPDAPAD